VENKSHVFKLLIIKDFILLGIIYSYVERMLSNGLYVTKYIIFATMEYLHLSTLLYNYTFHVNINCWLHFYFCLILKYWHHNIAKFDNLKADTTHS
jgi:hypothetical protein